jgi:hypothetical protein
MVNGIARALATAGVVGVLAVGGASTAQATPTGNWGQEIQACRISSCYPGGGSRGSYVAPQASDGEGPGYAWEIHTMAFPGKSSPSLPSV